MALGGILGSRERSGEVARRSEPKAIPGKVEFLHFIASWAQPRQQYEGSCWSKNQAGPRRKGRSELGIGVLRQAGLAEWAAKTAAGTSWPKRKEQNSTGLKRARQTRSHKTSSGDACARSSKPKGGRQRVRGCVNASCVIMCTVQCKRQNTKIVGGGWVRKPHSGAREDKI